MHGHCALLSSEQHRCSAQQETRHEEGKPGSLQRPPALVTPHQVHEGGAILIAEASHKEQQVPTAPNASANSAILLLSTTRDLLCGLRNSLDQPRLVILHAVDLGAIG